MDIRFSFSKEATHWTSLVENVSCEWHEFVEAMDKVRAPNPYDYITSPMGGDGKRCKTNALPRNWLALDLDGKLEDGTANSDADIRHLHQWLGDSHIQSLTYETKSSAENNRRLRAILTLSQDVDERLMRHIGTVMTSLSPLPNACWDDSVYRLEQAISRPPIERPLMNFEGEPIDVADLLLHLPIPEKRPYERSNILRRGGSEIDVLAFFQQSSPQFKSISKGIYQVKCPFEEHEKPTGTVYFEPSPENRWAGGFKCHRNSCSHRTIGDVYQIIKKGSRA